MLKVALAVKKVSVSQMAERGSSSKRRNVGVCETVSDVIRILVTCVWLLCIPEDSCMQNFLLWYFCFRFSPRSFVDSDLQVAPVHLISAFSFFLPFLLVLPQKADSWGNRCINYCGDDCCWNIWKKKLVFSQALPIKDESFHRNWNTVNNKQTFAKKEKKKEKSTISQVGKNC